MLNKAPCIQQYAGQETLKRISQSNYSTKYKWCTTQLAFESLLEIPRLEESINFFHKSSNSIPKCDTCYATDISFQPKNGDVQSWAWVIWEQASETFLDLCTLW